MPIIANFTPDAIRWEHVGFSGNLEPGQTYDMAEARANHILNKYSPRGIIQLEYGDDEETRKAEAMATWKEFWERQVQTFNQHNERMKNQNLPYIHPSKSSGLREHAEKLGQELIGPWVMKKEAPASEEVEELKSTVSSLQKMVEQLIQSQAAPKEEVAPNWPDLLLRAKTMNTAVFDKAICQLGVISECPEDIKQSLRERYAELKFTEPCPF